MKRAKRIQIGHRLPNFRYALLVSLVASKPINDGRYSQQRRAGQWGVVFCTHAQNDVLARKQSISIFDEMMVSLPSAFRSTSRHPDQVKSLRPIRLALRKIVFIKIYFHYGSRLVCMTEWQCRENPRRQWECSFVSFEHIHTIPGEKLVSCHVSRR